MLAVAGDVHSELKTWCDQNGLSLAAATERLIVWFCAQKLPAQVMVLYGFRPIPPQLRQLAARDILADMVSEAETTIRIDRALERQMPNILAQLQASIAGSGSPEAKREKPTR
jgi:hypothetical protein